MKDCKMNILGLIVCKYKTEKKKNTYSVNYNGNNGKSQEIYVLTYKFISKNQCQFNTNKQNIQMLIEVNDKV